MANPFAIVAQRAWSPERPTGRMRSFGGAAVNRLTQDFNPYIQSPTQEVQWVLTTLRARAQQLVRDNSHASGFVNELANQVIGPDGILLQAKVKTATTDALHKGTNDKIEAAWKEWGMPEHATADGYESWVDFQRMVIRTIAIDGEVFIRKLRYFDNPFGFSLQIIDAELVDVTYNVPAGVGQNEIRLGIEVNQYGRPVAYWVWSAFPGELGKKRERQRIPADQIIHRFVRYRANQVRGVTWFAPVLLNLKNLDGYEFNELAASRASAAKMGFILNNTPEAAASFTWQEGQKPVQMDAEPLLIQELLPGQNFQEFNPSHPTTAYKDFMKAVLRSIARGLGMAYTTLTGDLEAVNYSSIRAGLLSERDHFRSLQRWLGIHVHRVIYREWLDMALLSGALRLDSRLASNYYAVEWRPRGWKWVDPVNDLTAAALAIALGLDSRQRLAAEQGRDFEEIVLEIKQEMEFAESMGVDVSGAPPTKALPPADEADDVTDDAEITPPSRDEEEDATALDRRRTAHALRLALSLIERKVA